LAAIVQFQQLDNPLNTTTQRPASPTL